MIEVELGKISPARIWINDLPDIKYIPIEILTSSFPAASNDIWENKSVCLEYFGATDHCRYGLLGLNYASRQSKNLEISVLVGEDKDAPFNKSLRGKYGKVHVGIPKTYANVIYKTALDIVQKRAFPAGTLTFSIGAHDETGSSQFMFVQITQILMNMIVKDITALINEEIKTIILAEINKY